MFLISIIPLLGLDVEKLNHRQHVYIIHLLIFISSGCFEDHSRFVRSSLMCTQYFLIT